MKDRPPLEFEYVKVESLKKYPDNPRKNENAVELERIKDEDRREKEAVRAILGEVLINQIRIGDRIIKSIDTSTPDIRRALITDRCKEFIAEINVQTRRISE